MPVLCPPPPPHQPTSSLCATFVLCLLPVIRVTSRRAEKRRDIAREGAEVEKGAGNCSVEGRPRNQSGWDRWCRRRGPINQPRRETRGETRRVGSDSDGGSGGMSQGLRWQIRRIYPYLLGALNSRDASNGAVSGWFLLNRLTFRCTRCFSFQLNACTSLDGHVSFAVLTWSFRRPNPVRGFEDVARFID